METNREPYPSVHKEHEVLLKLEAAGLTDDLAQRVIDSKGNDLAAKVVRLIQNRGFEATTSQKRAREIMGRNMFGIEEAIKHFGVNPARRKPPPSPTFRSMRRPLRRAKIRTSSSPFSRFRSSISAGRSPAPAPVLRSGLVQQGGLRQGSWRRELAARPQDAGHNSTNKTWDEQQALLANNEETPTAQVMVYTIIGYFLATGERLFEKIYVRCSDVDSGGLRVFVGDFDRVRVVRPQLLGRPPLRRLRCRVRSEVRLSLDC